MPNMTSQSNLTENTNLNGTIQGITAQGAANLAGDANSDDASTSPVAVANANVSSPAQGSRVDNFVGSRLIEDFTNPELSTPSGVDYSWGSNF